MTVPHPHSPLPLPPDHAAAFAACSAAAAAAADFHANGRAASLAKGATPSSHDLDAVADGNGDAPLVPPSAAAPSSGPHSAAAAATASAPSAKLQKHRAVRPLYPPAWIESWAYTDSDSRSASSSSLRLDAGSPRTRSLPDFSSIKHPSHPAAMAPPPPPPTALDPASAADEGLTFRAKQRPVAASGDTVSASASVATPVAANAASSGEHPSIWSGFYKKALKERQSQLRLAFPHLFPSVSNGAASGADKTTRSGSSTPTGAESPSLLMSGDSKTLRMAAINGNASLNSSLNASVVSNDSSAGISSTALNGVADDFQIRGLDERIADNMVENCIGTMGLPVGLALNFVIDGTPTVVPMAVEEPSVVAAVSGAAKILSSTDGIGFRTSTPARNIITAQILLLDIPDAHLDDVQHRIEAKRADIVQFANTFCSSMYKRGGGVVDIAVRRVARQDAPLNAADATAAFLQSAAAGSAERSSHWLVVHLHIDVRDAMGANCASTVAEGTSPMLADLARARVGIRIVSNLNPARLSRATFRVPVTTLAYKGFTGAQVAARLLEAYAWARDDPYRATTHNKGIMNGIDAVAVATGQDWRAVEAACHSWAAGSGREAVRDPRPNGYSSLTRYWVERGAGDDEWFFCGELALPIIVGTRGGVLATAPVYQYTLGMMGFPDSKRLAAVMCCVGLAQNFAALRALATEGIQRGHMHLHARNIAIAAGAPTHAIAEVTAWMIEKGRINVEAAKEYVTAHHLYTNLRRKLSSLDTTRSGSTGAVAAAATTKPPSMFYFAEAKDKPLTLNIAFQTLGDAPVFLDFTDTKQSNPIHAVLLGSKTYEWLMRIFPLVDAIRAPGGDDRANNSLTKRLKIMSLILNVLLRRLMLWCPEETRSFVEKLFTHTRSVKGSPAPSTSAASKRISALAAGNGSTSGDRTSSNGTSRPKRPSIMRYIQSILQQSNKWAQDAAPVPAAASSAAAPAGTARPSPLNTSPTMAAATSPTANPVSLDLSLNGMEWALPDSGIFRTDLFDDEMHLADDLAAAAPEASSGTPLASAKRAGTESTDSLATTPTKRQILQVGFPLALAIWQVFEVWVTQYVGGGSPNLAAAILDEQRVIVSSLVATHADVVPGSLQATADVADLASYLVIPPVADLDPLGSAGVAGDLFTAAFHVQAKRSQCTLFLLIDQMTADPTSVTPAAIAAAKAAGFALEAEATACHDLARLVRDHRAVFGPGDEVSPDLMAIPALRSPDSPQLRFRRRSSIPKVPGSDAIAAAVRAREAAAAAAAAATAEPGSGVVSFHEDSVRNSVLTYAVLDLHRRRAVAAADVDEVPLALPLADIEQLVPAYLRSLRLEEQRARIGAWIVAAAASHHHHHHHYPSRSTSPHIRVSGTSSVTGGAAATLGPDFLTATAASLRAKLGVEAFFEQQP
ncbi:hypothetical protein H9P43_000644 [Blastocladiella emersonii ATCC 22665]|nr:hypothetical protein H9P43_000644 [Blastocladiella emersonii ATCC 22665]